VVLISNNASRTEIIVKQQELEIFVFSKAFLSLIYRYLSHGFQLDFNNTAIRVLLFGLDFCESLLSLSI